MRDRDDALKLDQQLCFALYNASRAMVRAYGPLLDAHDLTYPQYLALLVLWEQDGLSVKALGERLALDSGTLTPLLKRLEARGLVERRRSESDERVVHIALTKAGKRLEAKAREFPPAMACKAGYEDDAGLARLSALREQLVALTKRLEKSPR